MPFYFRKSIRAGPFRLNLSKSGIGASVGVPGLRVGTGPRGNYLHAGGGGLYYRAFLGRLLPKADAQQTLTQDGDEISYAAHGAPSRLGAIVFTAVGGFTAFIILGWLLGPTEKPEPARLVTSTTISAQRPSAPSPQPPHPPQVSPKQEPVTPPQSPPNKIVSAKWFAKSNVHVRAGPSTSSPIVRRLQAGAAVTSIKVENGWRRIAVDGAEGWIRADLLSEKPPLAVPGFVSPAPPSLPAPRPPLAAPQKPVVAEPGSVPIPPPNTQPR